jgi:hypothetical protein
MALIFGLLLCNCAAAGTMGTESTFKFDGSIVNWTAAASGVYRITVNGAQGGNAQIQAPTGPLNVGGLGSGVQANYYIAAGTTLDILVGGQGGAGTLSGAGGGGGSFVAVHGTSLAADTPLIIGGGGGGAEDTYTPVIAGFGQTSPGTGIGGSGGGAYRGAGAGGGGGGGAYANVGGTGQSDSQFGYPGGGGGMAFTAGGAGGYGFPTYTYPSGPGGFGGGGGGGEGVDPAGGGGGGGYSGGNGGTGNGGSYASQGGTSFYATNLNGAIEFLSGSYLSAMQSGNGTVSITLESLPTPEPSALALLIIGAANVSVYAMLRRRQTL